MSPEFNVLPVSYTFVIPILGSVRLLIHKPVHNYFDPYGEFKAAMCWAYIKIEFTVPQIQMPASAAR